MEIDAAELGVLWAAWSEAPTQAAALPVHLRQYAEPLPEAVAKVRDAAATERTNREDAWRPIAQSLVAWLPGAKAATEGAAGLPDLKKAEAWLKDATTDLRKTRFAPIADAARGH